MAALRTRIARNLPRYMGQRPLAGAEHRFTVAGIYEIALIDELERNGLTQAASSQVVRVLFENEIRVSLALHLSSMSVFHILNITSVLARVDERISDYMAGAPREVQPLA